ncbi:MAG: hypothetical protein ISS73_09965, partial [Pirellulales bacterium]|nr:hypothetical protein [Pirellulales bacterium]
MGFRDAGADPTAGKEHELPDLHRELVVLPLGAEGARHAAAAADPELPALARLAPLAEAAGITGDWRIPAAQADDIGERPDLNTLGPRAWRGWQAVVLSQPSPLSQVTARVIDRRRRRYPLVNELRADLRRGDRAIVAGTFSFSSRAKPRTSGRFYPKIPGESQFFLLNATAAADMLAWENSGFSVDASVRITLIDRDVPSYFRSLEHLLRYCARPPFALERLFVIRGLDGRIARI